MREADRIYNILTRDFGLVQAMALGVRNEPSKLRGHIEPFSLVLVSLVRGRDFWRLTSAQSLQNIPATLAIARPLALIEKLVQGEASHPELFDALEKKLDSAMIYHSVEEKGIFEVNFVAQILFHLGYLKESDLSLSKNSLIKVINEGIQASSLAG